MDIRHQQGNRVDASHTGVPAYTASADQPQMIHPTAHLMQDKHHGTGITGTLHRSGSSGSSSSEDDGNGGRRRKKKGIKDKIKEKLPGGQKSDDIHDMNMVGAEHQEKKGIMDKIKEKLPGSHHNN